MTTFFQHILLAQDLNDPKSTSGYTSMLSRGAVSWKSRKLTCVALSTAEAKYAALANTAQEIIWMRQLMENLECKQSEQTVI